MWSGNSLKLNTNGDVIVVIGRRKKKKKNEKKMEKWIVLVGIGV